MSDSINGTITQTISFDTIPYTILRPQVIIEVAANYTQIGLLPYPARVLIIGTKQAGNTAAANQPIPITRKGQAATLFGAAAQLTAMVEAFLAVNGTTPVDAIVAAVSGTVPAAATAGVALFGVAAINCTLPFRIDDIQVPLTVPAGTAAAAIATMLAAQINATAAMPVTAVATGPNVALTAVTQGLDGNYHSLALDGNVAQLIAATGVTIGLTPFAGGAGTTDVTDAIAAVATTWYTGCIIPTYESTALAAMSAETARRYAADGRLDMHVYVGAQMTVGQALSAAAAQNSPFITRLPMVSTTPPWVLAATLGGIAEFQLTNDPARQLKTLALPGVSAPTGANLPTPDEQEQLLGGGWSTFDVLNDGTVTLQRVVTCYQVSADNIPDGAWRDIMRPKTMSRIRYDFANYLGLVWPRAKLADDDSVAAAFDPNVATPRRLANSWAARCQLYAQQGWIENLAITLKQSVFQRDSSDRNRVNSRLVVDQIGNEMVFAGRLEFLV